MTDSSNNDETRRRGDAERQRRSRAHRRGDHRYCDQGCDEAVDVVLEPVSSARDAMAAWADSLAVPLSDPRRPMIEAALVLADMVDRRQGLPQSAAQLANVIGHISEFGDHASKLDEVRARFHHHRVASLVEQVRSAS